MIKKTQGARKLTLYRETLAQLDPVALRQAEGGLNVTDSTSGHYTCETFSCNCTARTICDI